MYNYLCKGRDSHQNFLIASYLVILILNTMTTVTVHHIKWSSTGQYTHQVRFSTYKHVCLLWVIWLFPENCTNIQLANNPSRLALSHDKSTTQTCSGGRPCGLWIKVLIIEQWKAQRVYLTADRNTDYIYQVHVVPDFFWGDFTKT